MSKFTNAIGIDVSKDKLDVVDYQSKKHKVFTNQESGFAQLLVWVKQVHGVQLESIVFCFAHTGLYSLQLCLLMEKNKLAYSMVPGLEIKRSIGIARGKNDKIDAYRIAQYAYLRRESITLTRLPSEKVLKLKNLLTLRTRMVQQRAGYQSHLKGIDKCMSGQENSLLFESQQEMIQELTKQIKRIEKEINKTIQEDEDLKRNYELATSVKGVGMIVGAAMLAYSDNFSQFKSWRPFASYIGTAPFEHESGSSIRGRKRVSNMANKELKALLSSAAASSIQYNTEMRLYYEKRLKEGKPKMLVQIIIKNKLVSRVFAAVKRGTPYVNTLNHAA